MKNNLKSIFYYYSVYYEYHLSSLLALTEVKWIIFSKDKFQGVYWEHNFIMILLFWIKQEIKRICFIIMIFTLEELSGKGTERGI